MRIVQTFWTKPTLNHVSSRADGNWLERKHNYMSWALSCLQLRKFYDDLTLFTDNRGKEILIDTLELPYTTVSLELEKLNDYHHDLWVIAKLFTYSLQQSPFIHVDGDFYAFKNFDSLHHAELLAQNKLRIKRKEVAILFKQITTHFQYLPEYLTNQSEDVTIFDLYNPGIFGGQNIEFINSYSNECLNFINNNIGLITQNIEYGERDSSTTFGLNFIDLFNTVLESHVLNSMMKKMNLPISCLLNESLLSDYPYAYLLGASESYSHPLYYHKKNPDVCLQVEYKLKELYPSYYYKIISCLEEYQL